MWSNALVRRTVMPRVLLNTEVANETEPDYYSTNKIVEATGNHVYFYSDVTADNSQMLMREIRRIDTKLREERISRGTEDVVVPIWLHIQSVGGDIFSGFAVADVIRVLGTPVYSIIEGVCASAATFISLSCAKRYITPNSFMLIHQLTSYFYGTHAQFEDQMGFQNKAIETMLRFYEEHSKMSIDKLRECLARDFWMTAQEALDMGFVDHIGGK